MRRVFEALKIVTFSVAAAIAYGILHDMVTANVCVEYFTMAHPPVFPTDNPFFLALGWGVIATWWVGLPLGILLAVAAQVGPYPIPFSHLRRRIVVVMVISAVAAGLSGIIGYGLGRAGVFPVTAGWNQILPPGRDARFAFDAFAHLASYGVGTLAGLALVLATVFARVRPRRRDQTP